MTRELNDNELADVSGGRKLSKREQEEFDKWNEYYESGLWNGSLSSVHYDAGINALASYKAAIYHLNPPEEDFLFKPEDWIGKDGLPW